ncbi:hypothetical protein OJAV_G00155720 [Oryzias javanicus]|uniref:Uncharacterized protein n=1 Tax=Oryzias javanicus TaxID=123683 RepID=A0A3S2U411_ORYJA|nr:hypothetical protein OJAV_G00155720 [Oryzias javanicus]
MPLGLAEEHVAKSNGTSTSLNSSLSSLDYDPTLSNPAGSSEEKDAVLNGFPKLPAQDQSHGREAEELSQWQCEFRGQIRALRQWLSCMEMRLPPLDSRTGTEVVHSSPCRETSLGGQRLGNQALLCLSRAARLENCLALEALLHT